jgi:hypothetical protein
MTKCKCEHWQWCQQYCDDQGNRLPTTPTKDQRIADLERGSHAAAVLATRLQEEKEILQAKLAAYERTDGQPSELEMHRADYRDVKNAGFESPGELLDAYEKLQAKLNAISGVAVEPVAHWVRYKNYMGEYVWGTRLPPPDTRIIESEGLVPATQLQAALARVAELECAAKIARTYQIRSRLKLATDALEYIRDDYAERFDLTNPSTNPGIKLAIEQTDEVLAAIKGGILCGAVLTAPIQNRSLAVRCVCRGVCDWYVDVVAL